MGITFGTVTSYCVAIGVEEAVLMSSVVMIESICMSSADCNCASIWTVIQDFEIFSRCCPRFTIFGSAIIFGRGIIELGRQVGRAVRALKRYLKAPNQVKMGQVLAGMIAYGLLS